MSDGTNGAGNVTKATFIELYDEAVDAKAATDSAQGKYRNVLKRAKAEGIDPAILKEAMRLSNQDRDRRESDEKLRQQYMIWLDKPLGHQGALDLGGAAAANETPEDKAATDKHKLSEAHREGHYAGKCGAAIESCPYQPGTEHHVTWRQAWNIGQAELVGGTVGRRGRPRRAPPEQPPA